eukprot:728181-Pelagomonas_calceolata.AAC.1
MAKVLTVRERTEKSCRNGWDLLRKQLGVCGHYKIRSRGNGAFTVVKNQTRANVEAGVNDGINVSTKVAVWL